MENVIHLKKYQAEVGAKVFARAFEEDPVMKAVFPDNKKRIGQIYHIM